MRLETLSIFVDDQMKALEFYTNKLGFVKHTQEPVGNDWWLTVVSPERPDGPQLLLEPAGHPAVGPYRDALNNDGIPLLQLTVDDVQSEHARLQELGVTFTQGPTDIGDSWIAVFDDTCGNLIQLHALK